MNRKSSIGQVLLISLNIMLVISSVALLHSNKAEFVLERFEGVSEFAFSLFDAVIYFAYLITGLGIGFLSARWGVRKPFIAAGTLGTAIITFLLPLIPSYGLLLFFRFVQGVFCVTAWQTLMTLILDHSDESNRGRNMGIFGLFMAAAMGLSPMIGGALGSRALFLPYYVAASQCLFAFVISLLWVKEIPPQDKSRKPAFSDVIRFASKRKVLLVPALFNFIDRLHMGFILFVIPLMLKDLLKLGPEYRGMLLGVNGAAYIVLQYPIGRLSDKIGRKKLLVCGSIGYGVLIGFAGFTAEFGLMPLVALFFVLGIFSGLSGPPNSALVGDLVAPHENPLAMAFFNFLGNVGMMFGPLFAGVALSVSDYKGAFAVAGMAEIVVLALNLTVLYFFNKSRFSKEVQVA